MKKLLLETNLNKIYVIVMILISLFLLGGYFSYAMFRVSKEKKNAISIVTGNLAYKLEVDSKESNVLEIGSNSIKEFVVTLSNPNNIKARFNFYYIGSLPDGVKAGYLVEEGVNTLPKEIGINLEKSGASGRSNTYKIKVNNKSNNSQKITLGVKVGLDYNNLELKDNEHLFEEYIFTIVELVKYKSNSDSLEYNAATNEQKKKLGFICMKQLNKRKL